MKSIAAGARSKSEWARTRANEYAAAQDFCQIFAERVDEFYTLALALTADHEKAEQCFLSALEACQKAAGGVFKNWALSWSRLAVIDSALRIVRESAHDASRARTGDFAGVHSEAEYVMQMPPLERFIFVLTVLNRYSVRECAILLRKSPQEVRRVRQRTLESLSTNGTHFGPYTTTMMEASLPL